MFPRVEVDYTLLVQTSGQLDYVKMLLERKMHTIVKTENFEQYGYAVTVYKLKESA